VEKLPLKYKIEMLVNNTLIHQWSKPITDKLSTDVECYLYAYLLKYHGEEFKNEVKVQIVETHFKNVFGMRIKVKWGKEFVCKQIQIKKSQFDCSLFGEPDCRLLDWEILDLED